jgi:hypothetical protein
MGYMRGGSGAGARAGHSGSTHWQSAGLALSGVGGVGSGAGLFNTLANLEIREDMPEDEKKAMVRLVIKMVGRLPGVSRQKAAESMVERTNWGAMEVKEDMERDTYCSVCHDEVSWVLPREVGCPRSGMSLEKWAGTATATADPSPSPSPSELGWELSSRVGRERGFCDGARKDHH